MTLYSNSMVLSNGKVLLLEFNQTVQSKTWNDPEDVDRSETRFYIDGVSICDQELPGEVTTEVIEKLELDATEDSDIGYSDSDEGCETSSGWDIQQAENAYERSLFR